MALISVAFLVSLASGYTLWKMRDASVFFGLDSPVNPGIYERPYDVRHFDALPRSPVASSQAAADEDFPALLAAAIGWDVPKLDAVNWSTKAAPGAMQDVEISYRFPLVKAKALFRAAREGGEKLFVVIPGYGMMAPSAFEKTQGSLSGIGAWANEWGFDVLAMEPIHAPLMAAAINSRLTMLGAQLHGLQGNQACDAIAAAVKRRAYESVVVYGLGSGGFIADILSVLCPIPKLRIMVDGLPFPLKDALWRAVRSHLVNHPLIFQFRRPLLHLLDASRITIASKTDKTYLLDEESMAVTHIQLSDHLHPLQDDAMITGQVAFIIKEEAEAARADLQLIHDILFRENTALNGWVMKR
jgi:hypothetical protein